MSDLFFFKQKLKKRTPASKKGLKVWSWHTFIYFWMLRFTVCRSHQNRKVLSLSSCFFYLLLVWGFVFFFYKEFTRFTQRS